jgi:hypothetical protein
MESVSWDSCLYRKLESDHSDGEVHPRRRANLWGRIAEPAENPAYLCLETEQHVTQMAFSEHHDMIDAFPAD